MLIYFESFHKYKSIVHFIEIKLQGEVTTTENNTYLSLVY